MSHVGNLDGTCRIPIKPDGEGYVGRECPGCKGYFKVTLGTGLPGTSQCYCAYCGFSGEQSDFFTREQLEYVKSYVMRQVTEAVIKDLKGLEFEHSPSGPFGIGISLKVSGKPHPIRCYREKRLETEVVCEKCSLRYAVYGEFAFCPDCGVHNSLQILCKNLELTEKELSLSANLGDDELRAYLVHDALENVVSAFDGYGREACRVHAAREGVPGKLENMSFQDLAGARKRVQKVFGLDLAAGLEPREWDIACRNFQKRHLLAHKMGVVDDAYLKATNDPEAVKGRRVTVTREAVTTFAASVRKLGTHLSEQLQRFSNPPAAGRNP